MIIDYRSMQLITNNNARDFLWYMVSRYPSGLSIRSGIVSGYTRNLVKFVSACIDDDQDTCFNIQEISKCYLTMYKDANKLCEALKQESVSVTLIGDDCIRTDSIDINVNDVLRQHVDFVSHLNTPRNKIRIYALKDISKLKSICRV